MEHAVGEIIELVCIPNCADYLEGRYGSKNNEDLLFSTYEIGRLVII